VAHGAPRNRRYTHETGGVNLSNPGEQAIELSLNAEIAGNYKNPAQRARLLTEHWVSESAFCPNCGHLRLEKYPNNRPVADFYCLQCGEDYELKSKQNSLGAKILDGSYKTKMERLQSGIHPNLFLLTYDLSSLYILDFFVIPKYFFVPEIIEKRRPLTRYARGAGWTGSCILLDRVPKVGKIYIVKVKRRCMRPKERVLAQWRGTLF